MPRRVAAAAFCVAALSAWVAAAEAPPSAAFPTTGAPSAPAPSASAPPPAPDASAPVPPPPAAPGPAVAPQPPAPSPAVAPQAPAASPAPAPAAPPAPAPVVAPAAPAAAPAPARPPTTAFVHLFSTYPHAMLELRSFVDDTAWQPACAAPCDRLLHVEGTEARVVAPGMSASNAFRIEPGHGAARFKVSGGSESSRQIGTVALVGGIPITLGGMALWGYGRMEDSSGLRAAGVVSLAVGAVAVLGSLPFLASGRTSVKDAKGKVIAQRRSLPSF